MADEIERRRDLFVLNPKCGLCKREPVAFIAVETNYKAPNEVPAVATLCQSCGGKMMDAMTGMGPPP